MSGQTLPMLNATTQYLNAAVMKPVMVTVSGNGHHKAIPATISTSTTMNHATRGVVITTVSAANSNTNSVS